MGHWLSEKISHKQMKKRDELHPASKSRDVSKIKNSRDAKVIPDGGDDE
jgi:hypothetical protein